MTESPSALQRLLMHERLAILAGLLGASALSWAYIVTVSRDMYGSMQGASAWMMAATWDVHYTALLFAMWLVMMIGMMLPSAAPAMLLFAMVLKKSPHAERPVARTYAFIGGYLLAWIGFSLVVTLLQRVLAQASLLSPMMVSSSPKLGAAVLVVAGLYQFTPLKQSCLTRCRGPAQFITQNFRPGVAGALTLGAHHGLYCVGCCWTLMLLLFVGGVMNLLWIAAITLFVLLEKLAPLGVQGGRLSGALLIGVGAVTFFG